MVNESNEQENTVQDYQIKPFTFKAFQYTGELSEEQVKLIESTGEEINTSSFYYDYMYIGSHLVFKGDYVAVYKGEIVIVNEEKFLENFIAF